MKNHLLFPTFVLLFCFSTFLQAQTISTYAGGLGNGDTATNFSIDPTGVAADSVGNFYFTTPTTVYKVVSGSNQLTVIAGTGVFGYSGDGGPAIAAQFGGELAGIAIDRSGNIYLADAGNSVIRKIAAGTGIISTIAGGNGWVTGRGDGGLATAASFYQPAGLAMDNSGNLYIADIQDNRIRKVTMATGIISTLAGGGTSGLGDGGPATAAEINSPTNIAIDRSGNVYIVDLGNNLIREVTAATGIINTIVGNGSIGNFGDGGPALSSQISFLNGIALDSNANVFITDDQRIRKITAATGIINTVVPGVSGNSLSVDSRGNLYISGMYHIYMKSATTGLLSVKAGNGKLQYSGDGGAATAAALSKIDGVTLDTAGNLYIADVENHCIRKVDAHTGIISTVAGNGVYGFSGDGGGATAAELSGPNGVAVDGNNNLYIADGLNNRIRKVAAGTGIITTVAGNGTNSYSGDGGAATLAGLSSAYVTVDAAGNLYIVDQDHNRIRKVTIGTGIISTVAGNGIAGYSGDGGQAVAAELNLPTAVAIDGMGNLYIVDAQNNCIRKVSAGTGIISTVAGNGIAGYSGDGGQAVAAELNLPTAVAIDGVGNLYIADRENNCIRKVDASTGIISTIAGNSVYGFSGDGGAATAAELSEPFGVAVDGSNNLYISDNGSSRVRLVSAPPCVPAVSISASSSVLCNGVSDTFRATPTNGGSGPSYQWYKNGAMVGTNSARFIPSFLSNNDSVWCVMTSNASCAAATSATSNKVRVLVINNTASTIAATICAGSSYAGHTSSGTYTDHYNSASGCDSARTLNLTVSNAITSNVNSSICAGSSYAGHTTSGTYTDHYTSASGCDSARTLNLTVANAITSNVTTSICSGASYTGHTASGTYTDHYTSASGCDSARTLNLTVLNAITSNVTTSICSGASYAGHTGSGTYTDHYTSASGCDSARTLNLTVLNAVTSPITATINSGQTYTVGAQTFGSTGTYTVTLTAAAANGCDSIVTLHLTVNGAACSPSVSVTCNNTNLDIAGTRVMTATPTNGGTNPVYNWYLNGTQMAGVHSSVLSYGGTLGNGDQIFCTLVTTSTIHCGTDSSRAGRTATSNNVTFTKSGSSSKDITTLNMPAQVGSSVINNIAATVGAVVTTAPALRTAIHPTRIYTSSNSSYGPSYANNQDFSHPVTYTVRAQDGSTKVWTVTVLDQSGNKTNSGVNDVNTITEMSIYPNPAVSYLNVKATGGTEVPVISIIDMEGRVMYHQALPVTDIVNHQIDLSDFATGSYIIYVAVGQKLDARNFVVSKQ